MRHSQWVKAAGTRYIDKCEKLSRVTAVMQLRDVLAFVLFTPQLRYEKSVQCWQHFMRTGEVMKENMWVTRQRWLDNRPSEEQLHAILTKKTLWEANDLLVEKVPGLGYSKAPFYLSLLFPMVETVPVCVDVHMLRAVKMWPSNMKRYQLGRAQERLQRRAKVAGLPSFAYQWALWDYQRSKGKAMVKETFLENDLLRRG